MKFLEIFGYRTSQTENCLTSVYDFDNLIKQTKEFRKDWCKTFLVKISEIVRIQQFLSNDETYYIVIVANQFGQGNLGKEKNELCVVIDEGEYVQIKEFLNQ